MDYGCPYCQKVYQDRDRALNHVCGAHGKTKAKKYKQMFAQPDERDTEAEWIIQGMIGER